IHAQVFRDAISACQREHRDRGTRPVRRRSERGGSSYAATRSRKTRPPQRRVIVDFRRSRQEERIPTSTSPEKKLTARSSLEKSRPRPTRTRVRLGLGQLLDNVHAARQQRKVVRGVLATNRKPSARWAELCAEHGV